jgi:hypothetical protein
MLSEQSLIYVKRTYLAAILLTIFSGFGNMPMYGRYYVSDIPGLGWSGNFFYTLYLHYLSGAVILAVSTIFTIRYLKHRSRGVRLTATGVIRVSVLGLVLASGLLAAIKNFPLVNLPMGGLMLLSFVHLGASMIFILFSLGCWLLKKPWMIDMSHYRST